MLRVSPIRAQQIVEVLVHERPVDDYVGSAQNSSRSGDVPATGFLAPATPCQRMLQAWIESAISVPRSAGGRAASILPPGLTSCGEGRAVVLDAHIGACCCSSTVIVRSISAARKSGATRVNVRRAVAGSRSAVPAARRRRAHDLRGNRLLSRSASGVGTNSRLTGSAEGRRMSFAIGPVRDWLPPD